VTHLLKAAIGASWVSAAVLVCCVFAPRPAEAAADRLSSVIRGTVRLPTPVVALTWSQRYSRPGREAIDVSIERVGGGTIEAGRPTWVLIHGRGCGGADMRPLATAIARARPGDQVLLLDWSEGAADNGRAGVAGSTWASVVADWADGQLHGVGLTGDDLSLVGHSWGCYVAYDMAAGWRFGAERGVRGLVALDPASGGAGLDPSAVRLSTVARRSWAFYDNDPFASPFVALSADESFSVRLDGATATEQHWACVDLFARLITGPGPFALDRLLRGAAGPWPAAAGRAAPADAAFSAVLAVVRSPGGKWDHLLGLSYRLGDGALRTVPAIGPTN
jgi:pimeloyl-ACP methyl ester carboxylesterase